MKVSPREKAEQAPAARRPIAAATRKPIAAATRAIGAARRPIAAAKRPIAAALTRHWLFAAVLVPAIALRAIAMLGFRWALWFNDSYQYVQDAVGSFRPDQTRPSGYSIYLRALEPFHNYAVVTISQHVMGVGIGVMMYALLRHRFNIRPWIATLAAVPALYDAYQIQLEHLLMADTLFAFLVMAAITIVMWRRKPALAHVAVAGLLVGLGAITRSIGLPLLAILAVYLLIQRVGLRVITAGVIACAMPVGGYIVWFHEWYHDYAMTQSTGIFLYARVMAFADCHRFGLPPDEKALCTTTSPQHRLLPQMYIWGLDAPLRRFQPPEFSPLTNKLAKDFATQAIKAQPLDYARVVWDDTWRAFAWKRKVFPDPITYGEYVFASASGGPARKPGTGHGFGRHFVLPAYANGSGFTHVVEPYAGVMRFYQKYVFVPGMIFGLLLATGLCGMALAWRRLGGEIPLPWALAIAMIMIPAATAEFDYRYVLPAVPLACLATAMVFGAGNPVGERLASRRARGTPLAATARPRIPPDGTSPHPDGASPHPDGASPHPDGASPRQNGERLVAERPGMTRRP